MAKYSQEICSSYCNFDKIGLPTVVERYSKSLVYLLIPMECFAAYKLPMSLYRFNFSGKLSRNRTGSALNSTVRSGIRP